jgi:hypothetical protein
MAMVISRFVKYDCGGGGDGCGSIVVTKMK